MTTCQERSRVLTAVRFRHDTPKREYTVSLDDDLVMEMEAGDEARSCQITHAVRAEIEHRRRHRLLGSLLD